MIVVHCSGIFYIVIHILHCRILYHIGSREKLVRTAKRVLQLEEEVGVGRYILLLL